MKSKDMQTLVFTKYQNGDGPIQICQDLCGTIGLSTIERWCKIIRETGSITLFKSNGRPRTIRTKESIQKVKNRLKQRKTVSSRKLARELGISRTSVRRVLKNDLGLHAYKVQNEPMLTDEHKEKRIQFANWIRRNFRKEETMGFCFRTKRCSTSMGSITLKMIVYGRWIVLKPTSKAVLGKNENFRKMSWSG